MLRGDSQLVIVAGRFACLPLPLAFFRLIDQQAATQPLPRLYVFSTSWPNSRMGSRNCGARLIPCLQRESPFQIIIYTRSPSSMVSSMKHYACTLPPACCNVSPRPKGLTLGARRSLAIQQCSALFTRWAEVGPPFALRVRSGEVRASTDSSRDRVLGEKVYVRPEEFCPQRWHECPEMIKDRSAFAPFSTGKRVPFVTEVRASQARLSPSHSPAPLAANENTKANAFLPSHC